jgi:ATP-dependent 26S proteasome regulatory subunit
MVFGTTGSFVITWFTNTLELFQVMRSEHTRLKHEQDSMKEKIRENKEKIKMNKQLPYLVGNVVEVTLPGLSYTCIQ